LGFVVLVQGKSDLAKVVTILDSRGGVPHFLNRWQEEAE
jgi:hypothetical protein